MTQNILMRLILRPPLWSELLATDPEVWVLFPAIPEFLSSSGPGTGFTQPREYNRGAS
jgi:hypothetical protein